MAVALFVGLRGEWGKVRRSCNAIKVLLIVVEHIFFLTIRNSTGSKQCKRLQGVPVWSFQFYCLYILAAVQSFAVSGFWTICSAC